MNLPELCIRRPVMTTLIMAAIVLFGTIAYESLPVSELPNVDFPTIAVSATLPGADPETMASAVATPLENQLSTVAGIDQMTSTSTQGSTRITLQFDLDRNIDAAAQDVQAAITASVRKLPNDMPDPPIFRKVNPADYPIIFLALSSPTLPLSAVDEYAERILAQRLSMINGVAQVNVYGGQQYAVRIQINPDALAARGIGIDEISAAAQAGNVNLPTGTLNGPDKVLTIRSNGELRDAHSFMNQIAAYHNGAPVRFGDVALVKDSVINERVASWYNDKRAIVLAIQRQPGTNTIEVVDEIKAILPSFQAELPAAMHFEILYDRSVSIRAAVDDVQFSLMLAAALVVMVIFLFLRSFSATLIPSLALPISVVGTFAGMWVLGYSLDNLSLMALTLSIGFVVDDAIVMLENIVRHIEHGEKPYQAAIRGSREIGFTIISMTASLIAVFIPVVFMGGIVGRLLHEFAITITLAIVVSGIVSLTLTPMLCSRFVKAAAQEHGRLFQLSEAIFEGARRGYGSSLGWFLVHRRITLLLFFATLVASGYLYLAIPKDFLPSEDTGRVVINTEGPTDISFNAMVTHQQALTDIVSQDPNVKGVMSSVGSGGVSATGNSGSIFVTLKPRKERALSADQVVAELRPKLAAVPGINAYLINPAAINVGGQASKSQYQFTLQDIDLDVLYGSADKLTKALAATQGFLDVTNDASISSPTANVTIDRNKAATMGITPAQIETALASAFGSQQISTIYTPSNQYQVILEVEPQFQRDANALSRLYLRASGGALVPLTAVATFQRGVGPLTVNHLGMLPAVTISFNLARGVALGQAVEIVKGIQADLKLPATLTTSFQGAAKAFESSLKGLGLLLVMAVIVVYIVLGILYESFIHPLTILSGLPSAGVGALATLMIADLPLSLYAFVGIIMLVGIVKKNAIMMIDFAISRRRSGAASALEAIRDACLIRFRPIMMTTMAALAGTLPIALGLGTGSESRRPLGLAVVGGLLVSQVLTLYITPVIYLYLDRIEHRKDRSGAESADEAPAAPMPEGRVIPLPARGAE